MQTISPEALAERSASKQVDLIDVRTPVEYREIHVDGARNIPLDSLDPRAVMTSRNGSSDQPLYVMCKSGARGSKACQKFLEAGYDQVVHVEGGVEAWEAAQLPVIRGKKTISLERQVRIAAGFLVLLGAVLAAVVHPYFIALPAFVGAGLMFAGITDSCAMGMMLAKMPWNQVRDCKAGSCSGS
jgi:rhodanese-related sulfurtransferase